MRARLRLMQPTVQPNFGNFSHRDENVLGLLDGAGERGGPEEPVGHPVVHEAEDAGREEDEGVGEGRPEGALPVAADLHLVILVAVQDHAVAGRGETGTWWKIWATIQRNAALFE